VPGAPHGRFRGRIARLGRYQALEVPAAISRAFAAFARAGRIRVAGRIGRASFTATLGPVAGGRHRLYVNGGLRNAAGVEAGDVVGVRLHPVAAQEVPVRPDLAAALRPAGRRPFQRLPAAQRRELLRWVDDARTPRARRKRIADTVAHVLDPGKTPGALPARPSPGLRRSPWRCPRCGNTFVNRNQWHSCARHSLAELLRRTSPRVRVLFGGLRRMVEACGPVRAQAYSDRVAFMVEVRFAGATPRREWLDVAFWLTRRLDSPRLRRVETLTPGTHIHHLRVSGPRQLDGELRGWIREAYAIGCRRHLRGPRA
jgi:hypothetical protein